MNVNLSTFSCWALDSHFISTEQEFEDKSKIFYQSAMCLINPKQDPPIFSKSVPNFENKASSCKCTDNFINRDEDILKFSHTTEMELNTSVSDMSINHLEEDLPSDRPFKCPQCFKTFLLKHHLTTHQKTHTGQRPHVCKHCGKSFTHKYCLNTHLLLHSNERPYQCLECKKRFTLKHHLNSHKRVHKRDRPFLCGECGKNFPLKKQLITHEKFHRGERPFVCKECGDTFAQENHLVMHLRFHGSINSFVCRECGATFTRKFELDNHDRIHGKQPMTCPTCSKEFLQRRSLLAHIRSHENQPPAICLQCGGHFPDGKSLNSHQTTVHSYKEKETPDGINLPPHPKPKVIMKIVKNKKFFCDICFRKFSAKHGLTQHKKRQHNIGSNIFACHICNKSFPAKSDLLVHKHNF